MPDWTSPAELQVEGAIFAKFMHALLGLYAYVVLLICSWFPLSISSKPLDTNSSLPWTLIGRF